MKYFEEKDVGAAVHSYRGATFRDLIDVLQQNPALNYYTIAIIARFNDHSADCVCFGKNCQCYIGLITYKFQSASINVLKLIATSSNHFINKRLL